MTDMFRTAAEAVTSPRVQALIEELSEYGLGVFVPHAHSESGGFTPLPSDTIQMESNLQVSFVKAGDPILDNATVVGWVWDKDNARVASACACSGDHFPGNCSARQ